MAKRMIILTWLLLLLLSGFSKAQQVKLDPAKQLLLLQLGLNYYTVVKEGRVDQDSSLLVVSKKDYLSRWDVITEGFGSEIPISNAQWIDKRDTKAAVHQLVALHGIDHIKLLLLLGAYYAFQPGYRQKDRDSAQFFLLKASQESESLHSAFWINQSLCLRGKNYFKGNQVKEGTECFVNLINSCQKNGDKLMEAKAWDYQGTYIPPAPATIILKINSIKKANDLYQQLNQPGKQINTLMNMAYLDYLLKDIKGSETSALQALKLQNIIGFNYIHYTCDLLSLIYAEKSNTEKDIDYELKAVKSSLSTKDSLGLAYFYARLGHVKYGNSLSRYPFSNYWLKKAVQEFYKNRDPDIYLTIYNLTENLVEAGKVKEAKALLDSMLKVIPAAGSSSKQWVFLSLATDYESLKNYQEAEKYYAMVDSLVNQSQLVTKDFRNSFIKYKMAQFYFKTRQYDKSKSHLEDYLASPGPLSNEPEWLTDAHMLHYKIDSLQGNYESAANHLRQYIMINKSIVDSNDSKHIAAMKIQLLMTQREKDLQILQTKSALQSQQANNTRKFIYLGIAVALLIIGMLYNRYYINKKQKLRIDRKNTQLQRAIGEKDELLTSKEWLLKEVHHRVKNNLHTVICLLESQAAYLENDALKAIENSQHRIYAMSLIHQKLYQSEDIKTVDMSVYLPEFVRYLNDSFETGYRIRFELDIEAIKLGASYAVPLSLIINEAVTNAIKYAFPGGKKGMISISLHQIDEQVKLVIADNGIGMNADQVNAPSASLGLKLLRGLSEDIKGDLSIENNHGTIITIRFKIDSLMHATIA
jgi:two-component sensor histidine kinase